MKTIIMQQPGRLENLAVQDTPLPLLERDEVLVEVYAIALNRIDRLSAMGDSGNADDKPVAAEIDIAGVVNQIGKDIKDLVVGDLVFGRNPMNEGGGFAQFYAINRDSVVKMPSDRMSFEEAATLGTAALTAYQLVNEFGKVEAGDNVLITGGSGSIGTFAIQLAKLNGGAVVTTADRGEEVLKTLGADRIINHKEDIKTILANQVDVLIDTVGQCEDLLGTVKDKGCAVTLAQPIPENLAAKRHISTKQVSCYTNQRQLTKLVQLVYDRELKVIIDENFPFTVEGVRKAFELLNENPAAGNIIIKVREYPC